MSSEEQQQQLLSLEAPPFPLSPRPKRSAVERSAVRRSSVEILVLQSGKWKLLSVQDLAILPFDWWPDRKQKSVGLERKAVVGFPPDFLWSALALMDFMQLSLRRAAHVTLASGVK
jgi:hypothetical protein